MTREDLLVRVSDLESQIKGLRTQLKNERDKVRLNMARKHVVLDERQTILLTLAVTSENDGEALS